MIRTAKNEGEDQRGETTGPGHERSPFKHKRKRRTDDDRFRDDLLNVAAYSISEASRCQIPGCPPETTGYDTLIEDGVRYCIGGTHFSFAPGGYGKNRLKPAFAAG